MGLDGQRPVFGQRDPCRRHARQRQAALPHSDYFRLGLNYWYLAPIKGATAVLKVRHGIVEEVGIADKQLTGSHRANRILMSSFD